MTKIEHSLLRGLNVSLWLKRDDLLHPIISGNKWRKLKYTLATIQDQGKNTVISMGGAYSNHLHALAYAGEKLDLSTIGIIRGERPAVLNPTLKDMQTWGMTLNFVSREAFRQYREFKNPDDFPNLKSNQYWLPEGGATDLALKGVGEILDEIDIAYDYLCVACGTGTTLAGLLNKLPEHVCALGFPSFKNSAYLQAEITHWLTKQPTNWHLISDYHFGGFAKITAELLAFIHDFEQQTAIPLEPVYTGKMLYGLFDLITKGYFKSGSRIIALHTGGLQGNRGYFKSCNVY